MKKQTLPLLFDGAMATYLQSAHGISLADAEEANLSHPDTVKEIHREYINAGAQAIMTNTFAANTAAQHADREHVNEILDAACRLAKEAAQGTNVRIFACIGPVFELPDDEAQQEYRAIIDRFLLNGMHDFIMQTFPDPSPFDDAARYLKDKMPDACLICQGSVSPDGFSKSGISVQQFIDAVEAVPEIDAVGFNCTCGPAHMLRIMENAAFGEKPAAIMPNAGFPVESRGRTVYTSDASYFAERLVEFARLGAAYVGGCCGTTPEHIAQAARLLRTGFERAVVDAVPARTPARDELFRCGTGRFVAAEIDPPLDPTGSQGFFEKASQISSAGADLVTVADCPVGRARGDSSLLAAMLKQKYGIEAMPHLTCRDRNLNASMALLLGLHMADIRHVLLVTGDPLPSEERERIRSVFHFNSVKFAGVVRSVNETMFKEQPFRIAGALNVNAVNFDKELARAEKKVEAGMMGALTQPVMEERAARNLEKARTRLGIPILAGIMPVISYRNACFLNNEMSGICVPDDVAREYDGKSRNECTELAVRNALTHARNADAIADGFYVITMLGRADITERIIREIKNWS